MALLPTFRPVFVPNPLFSIVSPVYRSEELVDELVRRIQASVSPLTEDYEIILVDDRSPDGAWVRIQAHAALDPRVQGLRLSRNFGQHCAITAGLDRCRGEWIVVLDCDLQDQPEEIPALFAHAQRGYDLVLAQRTNRQDSWGQKLLSLLFYRVLSYLTETPQDAAVANFGIYHRRVIAAVLTMVGKYSLFSHHGALGGIPNRLLSSNARRMHCRPQQLRAESAPQVGSGYYAGLFG